jgi:YegS/Rv2252/BmrU family lipid kinase
MSQPVALLVNPSAGGGRALRLLGSVERELARLELAVTVERTASLEHGRRLAVAAADRGDTVVTLSGDGLLGAVAGALAGREDAVIGVLPGGRGNDFARSCGIPADPVAACAVIAGGTARPIDLGELDGRTFIGIATVGYDSDANRIANAASPRLGRLVYAYAGVRALAGWQPPDFTVTVDGGEPRRLTAWTVAAANTKAYGGGMFLAPDAEPDDGALDVVIYAPPSKRTFLRCLPSVFRGTHVALSFVDVLRGSEIRIEADRPFTVYADGDPLGELPATIRTLPGAVRVLLPA